MNAGSNIYFYYICSVTICETTRTGRGDRTVDVKDQANGWVRILNWLNMDSCNYRFRRCLLDSWSCLGERNCLPLFGTQLVYKRNVTPAVALLSPLLSLFLSRLVRWHRKFKDRYRPQSSGCFAGVGTVLVTVTVYLIWFRMSGQTITDRITAAQHSVTGSAISKTVCKATTHEIMGPKKKHLDCK